MGREKIQEPEKVQVPIDCPVMALALPSPALPLSSKQGPNIIFRDAVKPQTHLALKLTLEAGN